MCVGALGVICVPTLLYTASVHPTMRPYMSTDSTRVIRLLPGSHVLMLLWWRAHAGTLPWLPTLVCTLAEITPRFPTPSACVVQAALQADCAP